MSEDRIAWKRLALKLMAKHGTEEQIAAALRAAFAPSVFPKTKAEPQAKAPAPRRPKLRLVKNGTSQ